MFIGIFFIIIIFKKKFKVFFCRWCIRIRWYNLGIGILGNIIGGRVIKIWKDIEEMLVYII